MDTLKKHLLSIREAYAVVSNKPATRPALELLDHYFPSTLDSEKGAFITEDDKIALARCAKFRESGLTAARQGKLIIAEYLFREMHKFVHSSELSPFALLMTQSANEAAAAYFDYQRKDFEAGIARITHALLIDETLEKTYGCTLYHLHRVRLLLNLIRLKRRQGQLEAALDISIQVANYLEQKVSTLPFPSSWNSQQLSSLPISLVHSLFEQAMIEIMFMVVGHERCPYDWLADLACHWQAQTSEQCYLSSQAHLWLKARLALQNKDHLQFLEIVNMLLSEESNVSNHLRRGVLVDLILFCRNLPLPEAHLLSEDIIKDVPSWEWRHLPPIWKSLFESVSA